MIEPTSAGRVDYIALGVRADPGCPALLTVPPAVQVAIRNPPRQTVLHFTLPDCCESATKISATYWTLRLEDVVSRQRPAFGRVGAGSG